MIAVTERIQIAYLSTRRAMTLRIAVRNQPSLNEAGYAA